MEWFEIEEIEMPKDREFLIYVGDIIGLCEWHKTDEAFFCVSEPAYAWAILEVNERLMKRITHWAELPNKPTRSDEAI